MRIQTAFLLTVLLSSAAAADDWQQTYPGTPGGTIRLSTADGSVTIRGWDRNEISAQVHTVGYTIGGSTSNDIKIVDRKLADGVEIEVVFPRHGWSGMGWNNRHEVKVELQVPRKVALTLRTADGSVDAEALSGKLDIETADGSLRGADLSGDVRLHTLDGSIRVTGLGGNIDARTADGSVNIDGRFDRLDATSADGSIHVDARNGSKVATPWNLRTQDGSIRLAIPSGLAADVLARSDDGSVSSNLDLAIERRTDDGHSLRGKLNGGGPLVSLQTNDGSIRIDGQ
jgi:DUF4097 and DUF4098 domain-containing protein YvlB